MVDKFELRHEYWFIPSQYNNFEDVEDPIVNVVIIYISPYNGSAAISPKDSVSFLDDEQYKDFTVLHKDPDQEKVIFISDPNVLYKTLEEAKEVYKKVLLKQYELKVLEIDNFLI